VGRRLARQLWLMATELSLARLPARRGGYQLVQVLPPKLRRSFGRRGRTPVVSRGCQRAAANSADRRLRCSVPRRP